MTCRPSPSVAIRNATEDDVADIAQLIEPFVAQRKLLPRTEQELRRLIPHGFVAEFEGRVVGCAALEIYSKKIAGGSVPGGGRGPSGPGDWQTAGSVLRRTSPPGARAGSDGDHLHRGVPPSLRL